MSDWIDLQLAHSLTPKRAPEELWARLQQRVAKPRKARSPVRWAVPMAVAAGVMVVLAQPVRQERLELVTGNSARVESWLAHKSTDSGGLIMPPVLSAQPVLGERSELACRYCHTL